MSFPPHLPGQNGPWNFLNQPVQRKIFISFHHANDKYWLDQFGQLFHEKFETVYDNSVENPIESNDSEYVNRAIRERYITGTSITVLLCGSETWKRKHVDWEIYSTLYMDHALLAILLPTISRDPLNQNMIVPDRYFANLKSGYAYSIPWTESPRDLVAAIEKAIAMSKSGTLKDNSMEKMSQNRT